MNSHLEITKNRNFRKNPKQISSSVTSKQLFGDTVEEISKMAREFLKNTGEISSLIAEEII